VCQMKKWAWILLLAMFAAACTAYCGRKTKDTKTKKEPSSPKNCDGKGAAVSDDTADNDNTEMTDGGAASMTLTDNKWLQAMTFNLLYDIGRRAGDRAARVCTVIEQVMPDTFGVQEATGTWMRILTERFGDLYESIGVSRDGTDHPEGEYSAIFYRRGMFREIESGTKWLSDTPDAVSKVEESSHPRILTYALLERCSDGRQILYVNTHLEHTTEVARVKQTAYLLAFLSAYTDVPIVLTGDFNEVCEKDSICMVENFGLTDSSTIADQAYRRTTFSGFCPDGGVTIDYVFVNEDRIEIADYRVIDEMVDGDYPSDHFPVVVRYRIKDDL